MRSAPVRCQVQAGSNVKRWTDAAGVEQFFDGTANDASCTNPASFFVREVAEDNPPQAKICCACVDHTEVWLANCDIAYVIGISVYVIGEEELTLD